MAGHIRKERQSSLFSKIYIFTVAIDLLLAGFLNLGIRSSAMADLPPVQPVVSPRQISFIPNHGQLAKEIRFYHQQRHNRIFFSEDRVTVYSSFDKETRSVNLIPEQTTEKATITGIEQLPGQVNYLKGDPTRWHRNLPTYSAVVYENLWPGIDLKFYGNHNQLEYDLLVAPGADPALPRFRLGQGEQLSIGKQGELIIAVDGQPLLVQHKPVAHQDIDGKRKEIEASFVVSGSSYGLTVAAYDRTRPLVIDPLLFSFYLGGSTRDILEDLAIDAQGYIYTVGSSSSTDYPTLTALPGGTVNAGDGDCVITRVSPDGGTIDRSTYLGGDANDGCMAIAIRSDGEILVTGFSGGGSFPVSASGVYDSTHGGNDKADIFVARLPYDLSSLRWATYIGGGAMDIPDDIALDADNNIFIIGYTQSGGSAPFPTTAGAFQDTLVGWQDAVLFRLNNSGSALDFSTYIGGSDGNINDYLGDYGKTLAVTADGIMVAGTTSGSDFPVQGFWITPPSLKGYRDGFFGRFTPTGTCQYLSLLGGTGSDVVDDLAVAPDGAYFVLTGWTNSEDFPNLTGYDTSHNGLSDAFVAGLRISSFSIGGQTHYQASPRFASLLGGDGNDSGSKVAVGTDGSIYLAGESGSVNFPVQRAIDASFNGGLSDIFVTKLSANAAALQWSTYLGGGEYDSLRGMAIDATGAVIGCGKSGSDDFPMLNPPNACGTPQGSDDGILFKLTPANTATAALMAPMQLLLLNE